jgi:hypothetical protein
MASTRSYMPPSLKKLKSKISENFLILGKVSLCASLVAIIFSVRIPNAYRTLWAEDGIVHIFYALKNQYPVEIFQDNFGGYWNVTSRVIARLVILFPIEFFTYVNFFLICAVTGLVIFVVYDTTALIIQSNRLRVILSLSVVMLPIAKFDVIATSVNLHYYLLFAMLLTIISTSRTNELKVHHVLTIVLGTLSDPLSIVCLVALAPTIILKTRSIQFPRFTRASKLYLILMLLHSTFIGFQLSEQLAYRQPNADHSLVKTGYLFLDRVIGSMFIPSWGEVSSGDFVGQNLSSKLLLRLFVGVFLVVIWICIGIYVQRLTSLRAEDFKIRAMVYLFISGLAYWGISGTVFNPEPRYAVFSALCILTICTFLVDQVSQIKKSVITIPMFSILIVVTWIFSWAPAEFRNGGVVWKNQIADAQSYCKKESNSSFSFVTIPYNWDFAIACNKIMSN